MKVKIILGLIGVIIVGAAGWMIKNKQQPEEKVHYHAGFMVDKGNQKIDFANPLFMSLSPCVEEDNEEPPTAAMKQIEKAHLHDNIGDVVHIEHRDARWQDLFTNINYDLDYGQAKAFMNGQPVTNFQKLPIKASDSLVVFIGDNDQDKFLAEAVTKSHIEEVGAKSEDCGTD